jgi:adenosylcobinamide-GDP ribazoletransferase
MKIWAVINGAFLFYTVLPLPGNWPVNVERAAQGIVGVGLGMGGLLAGIDVGLRGLGVPVALGSAVVVWLGVALTGGLHLDGAMDTADGLAVQGSERRLAVMADSRSGAFGVMGAIAILSLKIIAFATCTHHRWFALLAACSWSRWGQQWAIACYPYLRTTGKGAMHKIAVPSVSHTLPSGLLLIVLTGGLIALGQITAIIGFVSIALGLLSSWLMAAWLNHKLGGHTGDTYGAVVEWVEVGLLCGLSILLS